MNDVPPSEFMQRKIVVKAFSNTLLGFSQAQTYAKLNNLTMLTSKDTWKQQKGVVPNEYYYTFITNK